MARNPSRSCRCCDTSRCRGRTRRGHTRAPGRPYNHRGRHTTKRSLAPPAHREKVRTRCRRGSGDSRPDHHRCHRDRRSKGRISRHASGDRGGIPGRSGTHWPSDFGREQPKQGWSQLCSQQTPSTHWPERHSPGMAHGWPGPRPAIGTSGDVVPAMSSPATTSADSPGTGRAASTPAPGLSPGDPQPRQMASAPRHHLHRCGPLHAIGDILHTGGANATWSTVAPPGNGHHNAAPAR